MGVYVAIFCLIPILNIIFTKKHRKQFVCCAASLFFCVLALRSEDMGVDVDTYKLCYNTWKDMQFSEVFWGTRFLTRSTVTYGQESGYVWINWIAAQVGISFRFLLVIFSAIYVLSISRFIYKYSKSPFLSFVLFFAFGIYAFPFGILRQSLALSFLLFSLRYVKSGKPIRFSFAVLLAMWIHFSSICFFPVYYFSKRKFTDATLMLYGMICFAVIVLFPIVYQLVLHNIFVNNLNITYELEPLRLGGMLLFMIGIVISCIAILKTKHEFNSFFNKDNSLLFGMCITCVFIQCFSVFFPIAGRFAVGSLLIAATIVIPNVIFYAYRSKTANRICYALLVPAFVLFYSLIKNSGFVLDPYIPMWR